MPQHLLPALAIRAAVVATTTAAAALVTVLPAATAAGAPATPVTAPVSAPVTLPVTPVALTTPAPAAALQNAMSKIGAPYRWGAAGPNAFDCSGLVNWAFRDAGIALPRTSRAMSTVGTPVAKANLRPGDLVFFYRPVSHVGIYLGNGQIVHASNSRSPVKVSDINRMPFSSARRH